MKKTLALVAGLSLLAIPAFAQKGGEQPRPGEAGSRNMRVAAHIPLEGALEVADIEIEQELSRPYVYVPIRVKDAGFYIIDIKDLSKPKIIYRWTIESPELHRGSALGPAYLKHKGRYYFAESFQFNADGPDGDLGMIIFDVTGLPDTSKIKEVARVRFPRSKGGFHEIFAYKHSTGAPLIFTDVSGMPRQNIYDLEKLLSGAPDFGLVGFVPNPTATDTLTGRGYHDSYVGFDPASQQDRFYGAGGGGFHIYDVTDVKAPKLVKSIVGVAGMTGGHTFTPTPDGRYAVAESEYQYAPLRILDLNPPVPAGTDPQRASMASSRPIGAYTARWQGLPHNHEVRWPYVFVSHYEEGIQVFNMMDPTNPYTVAYYDHYDGPIAIGAMGGGVGNGSFGVDVRNADGLIVSSDLTTGFWAFYMEGFSGWNGNQWGVPNNSSAQDWDKGPDGVRKVPKVSLK
ncbi:MAG: hypothetical protein EXR93_01405 [Gemmatimonadetes bacterium]|nr:hypothetical protein [Gemmatimonadota bacterium]